MADFNFNSFQRWSASVAYNANAEWNYTDITTDTATITATGFFDSVNENNPSPILNVNDIIWIVASDGNNFATVTAITPDVTVSVFDVVLGSDAVGTANLADQAVTAAKIADNTITPTQVEVNGLTSATLALNTIQYLQVPVTSTQLKAMSVTPLQIIAAAGASTAIVIDRIWVEYLFLTGAYANGGAIGLQFGNTAALAGLAASSTLAGATFDGYTVSTCFDLTPAGTGALSLISNIGVFISNTVAPFITGAGSLNVNVAYRIVAV